MKMYSEVDFGMEALFHRTGHGGSFELRPIRMVLGKWHLEFDFDTGDTPRGIGAHVLEHFDPGPVELESIALCHDPHNCEHACSQCGCHEIGGRESLASAVVVDWGVGYQGVTGRAVFCAAAELALIADLNLYHRRNP